MEKTSLILFAWDQTTTLLYLTLLRLGEIALFKPLNYYPNTHKLKLHIFLLTPPFNKLKLPFFILKQRN